MKFSVASLFIAATLVSGSAVEQNQACSANYAPYAGAEDVVVVTEYLTVTAGAKRPVSSIRPTTIHSNGKVVITEVQTVTAGGKNEAAAGNGVVTPASQAPSATNAATTSSAATPVAQDSPTAAASVSVVAPPTTAAPFPAVASSSSPPAASVPPAQIDQASTPAQTTPVASQAPQPTTPVASQAPKPTMPAASQASQPTSGNTSGGSFTGDGTFFSPGLGSCGITNTDSDLIAAIPAPQYGTNANPNNAEVCGKCALVTGPKGQVRVTITDRCPVCKTGDLDLSPSA
ncbi:hypothetical protein H4S07_005501, partial [Coemansia furcata]